MEEIEVEVLDFKYCPKYEEMLEYIRSIKLEFDKADENDEEKMADIRKRYIKAIYDIAQYDYAVLRLESSIKKREYPVF